MTTLLISDLHLSPERPAVTRAFFAFLEKQTDDVEALYILGDLFEQRRVRQQVALLIPPEHRSEVEAEAVDVHLGDPVAQRVEDEPQRQRVVGVDGVAAAGDVPVGVVELHLAGLRVGHGDHALVEPAVVQAAEGQRRPERAGLGGVVVDHVQDDLEAGAVQRLDHLLELADLLAAVDADPRRPGLPAPVVAGQAVLYLTGEIAVPG